MCRLPCGALQATCFIQLRPLQTTTSPVMMLMCRPAGNTRVGGGVCAHVCGMKHDLIWGNTPYKSWPKCNINLDDKRLETLGANTLPFTQTLPLKFPLIIKSNSLTSEQMSSRPRQHAASISGGERGCSGRGGQPFTLIWLDPLLTEHLGFSPAARKATRWRTRNFSTEATPQGRLTGAHQSGTVAPTAPVRKRTPHWLERLSIVAPASSLTCPPLGGPWSAHARRLRKLVKVLPLFNTILNLMVILLRRVKQSWKLMRVYDF